MHGLMNAKVVIIHVYIRCSVFSRCSKNALCNNFSSYCSILSPTCLPIRPESAIRVHVLYRLL